MSRKWQVIVKNGSEKSQRSAKIAKNRQKLVKNGQENSENFREGETDDKWGKNRQNQKTGQKWREFEKNW